MSAEKVQATNGTQDIRDTINPIRFTDNETNETYTLDFNREAIRFAEAHKFKIEDISDYPVTKIPELFYYAFRMHHRKLARAQTDALLEKMGGLTTAVMERLLDLYNQAALSNNIAQDEEQLAKNARVTVEL